MSDSVPSSVEPEHVSCLTSASTGTVSQGTMVPESSLEISSIGIGDSGYEADDEVSVGYDGHGDDDQQHLAGGGGNEDILLFDPPEVAGGLDEHVADSMGVGGVEIAAGLVQLEDGDSSSDAGYQGVDEGDDEVISHRRRFGADGVRNLIQRRVRARLV